MIATFVALAALAGFALSSALETALLTLSFSEERRLLDSLAGKHWLTPATGLFRSALEDWKRHPAQFLMAILTTNAASSMLWCVLGLSQFEKIPWAPLWIAAALFVFGELIPKVMARRFPDQLILPLLVPFYGIFTMIKIALFPLARLLDQWTHWPLSKALAYPLTGKEIRALLRDTEFTQDIRPRSRLILESMLDFSTRRVKQAMRPASEVVFLDSRNADFDSIMRQTAASGYSRFPVSPTGDITGANGILYAKDLLFAIAAGDPPLGGPTPPEARRRGVTSGAISIEDMVRPCPILNESDHLGEALELLKREQVHLALVADKTGAVTGIISLEDILEEIVGEIKDEYR